MNKIKIPFLSKRAFAQSAQALLHHLRPSVQKVGAPPGTLTYTGQETSATEIKFFQYEKQNLHYEIVQDPDPESLLSRVSSAHVNWIDITGFQNLELLTSIGKKFEIDHLTMEDLLNVSQLPKIEEHENYLYVTLKLLDLQYEHNQINFTHYSLIIKEHVLITFCERPTKLLTTVEDRLKNSLSKLRNSNLDYLSYRLIDTIVDHYYYSLEWLTNVLADLEIELVEQPSKKHINTILTFKKQWLILRKTFNPFKEAVRKLVNAEPEYMRSAGKQYITDLNDHMQSIGETMEILRESLESLMDLYNSTVSNKMNEVMQVLTIVSTIFIPLTFIAGIYGMNFQYMPELAWKNGYFYTLGTMVIVGIAMVIFMKRKRWF